MSVSGSSTPILVAESSLKTQESTASVWIGPLLALAVAGFVTLFLFRGTSVSIAAIWGRSSTYSYGFVIIPICAYLVWLRKAELRNLHPTTSLFGLALFPLSAAIWLVGNIADVQLVQHVALVAMVDALVWSFLGTAAVKVLRFAMVFLFLAVPVGDSLVPLLQQWTAAFTVTALRLSGIPAFQDGLVLSTPSGGWQVAEACSGIRYLIASIVIGILVAGVAYRSWKRRIAILLFSALLPIIANAIRAYGIVALAYVSGNAIATGVDHIIYGFVFFSLLTAVLLAVALKWYEPRSAPPLSSKASLEPPVAPIKLVANLLGVIVMAVSATALAGFLWSRPPAAPRAAQWLTPPTGWVAANDLDQEWAPEPAFIQSRTVETFVSGPREVSVFFGPYSGNRGEVELINPLNAAGQSGVWTLLRSGTREATIGGKSIVVMEHTIARGPQRRLVWFWYSIGDVLTSNPYRLRGMQAGERLLGHPQSPALYAVSAPFRSEPAEAGNSLTSFLK